MLSWCSSSVRWTLSSGSGCPITREGSAGEFTVVSRAQLVLLELKARDGQGSGSKEAVRAIDGEKDVSCVAVASECS